MSEWFETLPAWTERHLNGKQAALPPVKQWRWLIGHSGLPGATRAAAMWLAEWAEIHRCTDKVFIRIDQWAFHSGYDRKVILRAIAHLEQTGWLQVIRHPGGRRHANDYVFTVPDFDQCPCGCESR